MLFLFMLHYSMPFLVCQYILLRNDKKYFFVLHLFCKSKMIRHSYSAKSLQMDFTTPNFDVVGGIIRKMENPHRQEGAFVL